MIHVAMVLGWPLAPEGGPWAFEPQLHPPLRGALVRGRGLAVVLFASVLSLCIEGLVVCKRFGFFQDRHVLLAERLKCVFA